MFGSSEKAGAQKPWLLLKPKIGASATTYG
jgi:hypothetical protein